MNDALDQKTDDELNDRFAVEVAGWTIGIVENKFSTRFQEVVFWPPKTNRKKWPFGVAVPKFTTDANAILPWLETAGYRCAGNRSGNTCATSMEVLDSKQNSHRASADWTTTQNTFARAAVIALIRASRSKG